ncbi:MAG: S-layer homology domain-containing protein [Oscillospiraceae bacterium]|nr:S-layer homology domain-containing protein [Oscillospiraceae bacterium]
MKKTIAMILCVAMLISLCPMAMMASYSDMPAENHWSYQALNAAVEQGLLQGSNGKLLPNDKLTRAQMATILVRAYGATEKAEEFNFSDVPAGSWFYDNMSIAVKAGWFKGDGGSTMRPNAPISRQEAFAVLARAIGTEADDSFVLADKFTDAADVATWFVVEISALAAKGYVNGSNGKLDPKNEITRAQFAQVMFNLISDGAITLPEKDEEKPNETDKDKENNTSGGSSGGSSSGGGSFGGGGSSGGGSSSGSGSSGGSTGGSGSSGGSTGGSGSIGGGTSGGTSGDNDVADPWGDLGNTGGTTGDETGDNDASDPWGDETVVPEDKEPSMEDLATSDEGWTGIY